MTFPKEPSFNIIYDIVDYINSNAKANGETDKDIIIMAYYLKNSFTKKFDEAFEEMVQEHLIKKSE